MSEVANTPSGTGVASTPSASPSPSAPSTTPAAKSNAMSPSQFRAANRGNNGPSQAALEAAEVDTGTTSEEIAAGVSESEPDLSSLVQDQSSEEDYAWLDNVKPHRQLHGLNIEDVITALNSGQLPPELAAALKTTLKNGEDEWEVSYADLPKAAMRHQDYTRKLQAFSKERDAWNADKGEFLTMLQGWKTDPPKMLEAMEELEFPILEVAKLLAKQHEQLAQMHPAERELFLEKKKIAKERREWERQQQRLQQNEFEKTTTAKQAELESMVQTTAKPLFDGAGIEINERTWGIFLRNLGTIAESYPPGTPWTTEMVEEAFGATAETYNQVLAKRNQVQAQVQAKQPQAKFSSPAREQVAKAGITQKIQGNAAKPKGGAMTPSQFRAMNRGN